eukprot:m.182099 g.182099  ORF g.182099 m.182099 type:complete len:221 (-) comp25470_c0_seq2:23-685(-)
MEETQTPAQQLQQEQQQPSDEEQQKKEAHRAVILAQIDKVKTELGELRAQVKAKEQQLKLLEREAGLDVLSRMTQTISNIGEKPFFKKSEEATLNLGTKSRSTISQAGQSKPVVKTSEALKTAAEKTGAAFKTVGAATSQKLTEMKQSESFQNMNQKWQSATNSMRQSMRGLAAKVSGQKQQDDSATQEQPSSGTESARESKNRTPSPVLSPQLSNNEDS